MSKTYGDLPNERISGANGVDYAYRDTGGDQAPLVLLQHFRGDLDSWDPALVDALAGNRRVITRCRGAWASARGDRSPGPVKARTPARGISRRRRPRPA